MADKIIVVDDFLNKEELEKAVVIVKDLKWNWGHESKHEKRIETPFWKSELMENEFFHLYLTSVIEQTFKKKFKVNRLYANAHTFGQDGAYHTDCDKDNTYTLCLYLSKIDPEYVETAGGHIFFKLPDVLYKLAYEPLFNRAILFPSKYIHRGCSYSRYVMDLRICVAWKLEEII